MKQRLIGLALVAGCALLGAISFLIYMGQDRIAPEIQVEEMEITYTEGEDYEGLLEGVTAEDNRDGDLTDKIFIEKIIPLGNGKAVVYYGVMDKSNNVGKADRMVSYNEKDEETEDPETEDAEEEADEESDVAETPEEQPAESDPVPNGVRPAMALTANEMTIAAGEVFDPMSVVRIAVDDVDNYDVLSRNISLEGEYNTSVPGAYSLVYYVTDSDGNVSDPIGFTLIVQ